MKLGVKEIPYFYFSLLCSVRIFKINSYKSKIYICIHKNRGGKSQQMGYSLREGKREKPLAVAWPRRKFHGKTTDDPFSVVCGGVCPVSHRSHTVCIAPRLIPGLKSTWWAQGECRQHMCIPELHDKEMPAPWLHKDVPTSFCLGE